ncbi:MULTISPECIES: DUF1433 domain-containing protein [Bacillus cereus group]|jgi:DNA-directed RNA polymerase subunit E'/Rpb7|uniref:DUF1433 domain-containing protein n=1 Tax=Bacillus cereus group TaxID=86661 RepID=UPI000C31E388|nr:MULTISPECIES: DUF1433 domain-containing protein [Bacillus cereus group]AUD24623.1 DUF1433 domain-containing protein [Bacillus sp. HBCD-sjtu]KAA2397649.1 DUF1433 domain-containing protein [Bacillus cereus]MDA1812234.1 DUF1433 domain-containing protein [Bacillus cereus]MDH8000727.1 DUF1433 domain-containing protein [Bacillus cereus]NKW83582.1 DUF1433 domain-containing protein [Bacillus cereus]
MDIKIKKISFFLFFTFILSILGGCTIDQKNTEQQIVNKATETTIQYFKEKENLEVTITNHRFPSNDIETIFITGHIKDDTNKKFTTSIDYKDDYNIGSISTTNFSLKR